MDVTGAIFNTADSLVVSAALKFTARKDLPIEGKNTEASVSDMKLDKSDLDADVLEDGETTTSTKSGMKTTAANGHGEIKMTIHELHCPNGCVVKTSALENGTNPIKDIKRREPTEDTEEVTGDMAKESHDVNFVSVALDNCHIDEGSKMLEKKMALLNLVADDNCEEGNGRDIKQLKTQTSVITVDPPSLNSEEEEERCEEQEDLTCRGPTAGRPVNYCPSSVSVNHVARKAYDSHNMDALFQVTDLQVPSHHQQPSCQGFPPISNQTGYDHYHGSHYMRAAESESSALQMSTGNLSGKRRVDEDASTPFKYTRPLAENMGYDQNYNSNIGMNNGQHVYTKILPGLVSGGQVVDNSPKMFPVEHNMRDVPFQSELGRQFSASDVDQFLEVMSQFQTNDQHQQKEQTTSTNSQHFQQLPPQTVHDLKTRGKPFQQNLHDCDAGYISENSPHCEVISPSGSPKSAYSPPPSVMSGDSGVASPQNDDAMSTHMPSPASDHMAYSNGSYCNTASPQSVGSHPGSVMGCLDDSPSDEYVGQFPFGLDNAPYTSSSDVLKAGDMSTMPWSQYFENDGLSSFFNLHKDELKDALEVVAKDIQSSSSRGQLGKINGDLPLNKNVQVPSSVLNVLQPANKTIAPAAAVPTSVTEAQGRPSKLPLPALAKPGGSTTSAGAVPMVVVPPTIAPNRPPAVTVAPVLMMPPGQQFIFVVNSNPQPAPKLKPQFVPIKPKIPSITQTTTTGGSPKTTDKLTSTHIRNTQESNSNNTNNISSSSTSSQISSAEAPEARPASSRSPNTTRSGPQQRMLNIARRLVASMTKNDLQFQDSEGDTYLHVSVCKADCNMVQALLERLTREQLSPMINMQNCMRQTPLYLAVSSNHPEMVRLLLQFGADVNIFAEHLLADGRSKEVKTALHCAALGGRQYLDTLKELLAAPDLQVDLVNSDGHTALHCAILEHRKPSFEGEGFIDNLPIIQALIRHGADPNAQVKKSGKTALMYALECRDVSLVEDMVSLIDPVRLRTFLKTPAFDGSTCTRIAENLRFALNPESCQRLFACLRINGSRKDSNVAS